MLDPALLRGIRDENAFIFSSRACFAIIAPHDTCNVLERLHQSVFTFVNHINLYSPLRVKLEAAVDDNIIVVEMNYSAAIEQSYFSHLMWTLSRNTDAWIHIWDTHEHDALRRDFTAPEYMDSLLCINRLWIRLQLVHMITKHFTAENPHGELVDELTLDTALECLRNDEYSTPQELNKAVQQLQSPVADAMVDVCQVYLPRSLVVPLARHPWLITPMISDPTKVLTSTLSSMTDLNDESPFTVAVPRFLLEQAVKSSLTAAQTVSLAIKANIDSHVQEHPEFADCIEDCNTAGGEEGFLLRYLQDKLMDLHILPRSEQVYQIKEDGGRFVADWTKPFSIFTPREEREWTKAQELKAEQLEAFLKLDLDDELLDEPQLSMPLGEDRNTVEKLQGLLKNFKSAFGETPRNTEGMYESLDDDDVEKLTELEDFEDFIEFFAQNYMGFGKEDLEAHHQKKKRSHEPESELNLDLEFDWDAYNDDSDYNSEVD